VARSASARSAAALRRSSSSQVPVGNGRKGDDSWIIAEHGTRAGWVRNIQHDPSVRIRLRSGLCYRWVGGTATIRPDEDPLARQRKIIAWHPLRALNAVNVRVFGADLLAVHVQLHTSQAGHPAPPEQPAIRQTPLPRPPGAPRETLASAVR
jgi:F420H(2)-dependent quinone reductase